MYRLYADGRFIKSFHTRDDAVAYAVEHGYEEFEVLDRSDAA
jgi:hypothetical protein